MQKRLFIAINLPPKLKTELGYLMDELSAVRELKLVGKDRLHITLVFLGYVDDNRLLTLKQIVDRLAARTVPLKLTTGHPVIFNDPTGPRGIWAPVQLTPELTRLTNDLRAQLATAGFAIDAKPFAAHITLARANHRAVSDEFHQLLKEWQTAPPLPTDIATSLTLFSSELTPSGSVYAPEHTIQLN